MGETRKLGARKDPARQVLGMALPFLALGAFLLVISMALGLSSLREPVPYLFGLGVILLLVALAIRVRRGAPRESRLDSSQLNSSMLGSQFDSRMGDAVLEPSNRNLPPPAATWNAQVFRDIEWRRFEAVCAALFAQAGFEARSQSHGADGGVDIWLYSQHAQGPAAVVQCKHRLGKAAGVKELREFHGVMMSNKLLRGTFATTGTFSPAAREFAKANGISALDGLGLLALISQRTSQQKKDLLQLAYEGEYWRPTCANCGAKMVERRARKRGRTFWGCPDYPRCNFTLPVRKTRGMLYF